ncbi:Acyltransferase family protein [Saccharopolyspora kobensis]|uniref:Acyltransferase family protein n=3 Tax=Saccharopolyspora kobensis TaxID=146035 RepID=A0A1H6AQY1_9PSEU|nr:acyltransferase [Saccharopolyspora kobensis]SEG50610.1 Acyltransferase family protein [Saccharopolyspora kobensis]SFE76253.1 Acyltransferase family protein [Saccharopolyspora kobensis]
MTILRAPFAPAAKAVPAPSRDRVLDLIRAGCLVVVVVLHAVMAGIEVGESGIQIRNALENQQWFTPISWIIQVMPLFFIVGGFAGITQWRRMRDSGATPADFVRARLVRLARPALVAFAAIAAALAVATAAGAPAELLAQVGFRMGQPMWFIGVYLGISALVPLLGRLHERAPRATLAVLVACALGVDQLAMATGIPAIGFGNLAFVWLAVQQIGFWYADGWFRFRSDGQLLTGALGAFALLLASTTSGLYPADMLANLNPPTANLVLLGVVQVCLLARFTGRLAVFVERPVVRSAVDAIGKHSLTVYLWHMPALVLFAAVLLVLGLPWPEPLGFEWWLTRGSWLAGVAMVLVPLTAQLGRFERGSTGTPRRARGLAPAGVLVAIAAVVAVLVTGFTVISATIAAALLLVALRMQHAPAST